uniref:Uncharacterized protein n=1 Tax=Glossina palpalis gambiensis TaxID=67801 RepID=A0A1B0BRN7_9MUSC
NHEDSKLLPQTKYKACNLKSRYCLLPSVDPTNIVKLRTNRDGARPRRANDKSTGVADIKFVSLDGLVDFLQKGEETRTSGRTDKQGLQLLARLYKR